jgi:hypothetical protein
MTEQPTTPEPPPRPLPSLGRGGRWGAHLDRPIPRTEPYQPKPRPRPAGGWPKTGDVGASAQLADDEEPVTVPARPYGEANSQSGSNLEQLGVEAPVVDFSKPGFGIVSIAEARSWGIEPPPAVELLALADDLNTHGGLDETFVAALLREAVDPYADAKRGLGIVDTPSPVTTTEPISYETIVEALEKIAPLGPLPLDTVKLTQEQVDAITASQPHVAPSAEPWHYFGTPVEIVETVEESTPYQLRPAPRPDPLDAVRERLGVAPDETLVPPVLQAVADSPATHQHIWTATSPMRCVDCRRYLRPWWRRTLDRARRWGR